MKNIWQRFKKTFCTWTRHSRIHTNCFGYKYCARCGEQVGDSLAGYYYDENTVVIGHNCPKCFENYKKLSWIDKFLTPYPFKELK